MSHYNRTSSRFQTSDLSKLLRDTTESAKNLPEVKRGQRSTGDKNVQKYEEKKSKVITTLKLKVKWGQTGSNRGHVRTVSRSVLELKFPKFVTSRREYNTKLHMWGPGQCNGGHVPEPEVDCSTGS